MNYTENYHLPQWEKSDRVLMEDFNRMCQDLESGLAKTAQDAAGDNNATAQTAAQAVSDAAKAQSTANSALAKANVAYSYLNKPFVIGTYVGTGNDMSISVGFTPSFLIVSAIIRWRTPNSQLVVVTPDIPNQFVNIVSGGFTVVNGGGDAVPHMSEAKETFAYIAFR